MTETPDVIVVLGPLVDLMLEKMQIYNLEMMLAVLSHQLVVLFSHLCPCITSYLRLAGRLEQHLMHL